VKAGTSASAGQYLKNPCCNTFSWTCVLSCSAAILVEISVRWTRIFNPPQRQVIQRPNNFKTPAAGNQNVQRIQAAHDPSQTTHKCYACGERGHYANQCPNPRTRPHQTATSIPAPTRGAHSISVAAKQNYARGRVNHVVIEEASDVVFGIFFINTTSAVMLFDSRASHSFISTAYVEKHNLPIALLKCQLIVSSPGGDMPTRQLSYPVPRKRERSLHTCAQDVQITRMATIDKQMQCYK
jgi:hypothetical protein